MRTEQFLEGYDECRDKLVEILRLNIPIEDKIEKVKHLAEFAYYEKYDGQTRWVDSKLVDDMEKKKREEMY